MPLHVGSMTCVKCTKINCLSISQTHVVNELQKGNQPKSNAEPPNGLLSCINLLKYTENKNQ